jgi:RimJ/RimL family protein N-acetyltransferase
MSGSAPRVRLREATIKDADLLELWRSSPVYMGEFNDFGLRPEGRMHDFIATTGLVEEDTGRLVVERIEDRLPLGMVSWRAVSYGPNLESRAWQIGISLIPEARGKGYGGEAQRLLAQRLLATTDANRVEASTDVENHAEQRALEKAGFRREGVLRGSQYRAGRWHDMLLYAILREDLRPRPTGEPR